MAVLLQRGDFLRCRKLCSTFVIPVSHLHQGGCSAILAVNYDVGVKRYFAPSDTELLRALHSRNSKNIRNSLIFLQKMATYSCFLRVPSSKILLQASLHRILDLLTLVSYHLFKKSVSSDTIPHFRGQTGKRLRLRNRILHSNGSVCPCR